MFQLNISLLLKGEGCIQRFQNHIAMLSRKCFSYAVDGVVRKFRTFVQGIVISRKVSRMAHYTNVELTDLHLAYRAVDY